MVKPLKIGVGGVGRENGKIDYGGRGENGGIDGGGVGPPITNIVYYDNDAVDDTVDTMSANNFPNEISDGKMIPPTTTMTRTTTTMGKGKFLLRSHSKPLPPGPPLGNAGRFEVFLDHGYPDQRKDGWSGGVGEKEEDKEGNAVRVPSSKIFEYMSRG